MRLIPKVFFVSYTVFIVSFLLLNLLCSLPVLAGPGFFSSEDRSSINKQKRIQGIIDDFIVNDDTISVYDQSSPTVAKSPDGNFIIVWEDRRNGNYNFDIYAQKYDSSGTPLGSNFKVNDNSKTSNQFSPAIAIDDSGNFVIAWSDSLNIYAQRYNSSGTPRGSNFKVNDDNGTAERYHPAVATDGSGNFVLAWTDTRNGNGDIYAQRYNSSGSSSGSNFRVNDNTGSSHQEYPAISMDGSGSFIIAWQDYRNGNWDIYSQRYNSTGLPVGSNSRVNEDAGNSNQKSPAVSSDRSGRFVIAWRDERNGNSDIYAQKFDSTGSPVGSNLKINDDPGFAYQGFPAVAAGGSGNSIITWVDWRNGNRDIYAQRYDSTSRSINSNFEVNDDTGNAYQEEPAVAVDFSGNFILTYQDSRNGNQDIYAQRYNAAGQRVGHNFNVNTDASTSDQEYPVIAANSSGGFVLAWQDYRNGDWDIYVQRYNSSGIPVGSNIRVNDDSGTAFQRTPAVSIGTSGSFILTWTDYRNGNPDIYVQIYNSSGIPSGSNFKVNDIPGSAPAIMLDWSGNFVIAWQGGDVFARRYDYSGAPLGSIFKVNDDTGFASHESPVIAADGSGNFILTWTDYRNGKNNPDIYAQKYNSSDAPLGFNFKVNDDTGSAWQRFPAVAVENSGNFVISWQDARKGNFDIYSQRYNSSPTPLGSNFEADDDILNSYHWSPAITMADSGSFVIAWHDFRNGNPDIYAQTYNAFGIPAGSNYLVSNPRFTAFEQAEPSLSSSNSRIYFTWMENRIGNWDIYARVVDWTWTKVGEDESAGLPKSFELSQNYPNPFNPSTTLPFTVKSSQWSVVSPIHTTLKVYNILGQLVRILVDEEKAPGNYKVVWDGKDNSGKEVSSGIYFYQLKTEEYTATRKMVLLR